MSKTLNEARMPSLADKIEEEEKARVEKALKVVKKSKKDK